MEAGWFLRDFVRAFSVVVVSVFGLAALLIGSDQALAKEPPVAAYSFDAGEGEVAEDLFGEHDGAIVGASWFDKGKYGQALSFDGENDCVTIEDAEDLQLSDDFTLEAWVKPAGKGGSEPILFKEKPYFGAYALYYGLAGEGDIEGLIGDEWEFVRTVDGANQEKGVWLHVALTYDGAHMRLYVNGELIDTAAASNVEPSSGDLSIGCSQEFGDNFEGLIDEVRVYDRALSLGEVTADAGPGLQTPSRTPVAAYSFDAGEGEVAEDLFGEHDGAIEGASWFDKGRFGQALDFDGENDCVTVEDAPDLQLTEELTLEAWVKPEGNGASEPIIFKETPWFGGYSLYFGIFENGHMEGFLGEEGYVFKSTEDPEELELGAWSHVALTFDGGKLRLYVDGELVDSTSAEGAWATSGPLSIGCSVEFEDEFEGKIDEVRVYNRALSSDEIATDAVTGLQAPSRFPVAAYSFDAGSGEVAEDLAGDHDGAIEGPSWFDNGKYGKALAFDGENDCVTIEDAEDLRITEELTVEAWVKPYAPLSDDPVIFKDTWGETGHALGIGIFNTGKPEAFIGEGEGEFESVVSSKSIEANIWSHLTFTFDGARMRLYVDGELVASKAQSQGPIWGEGELVIGCNPNYPEHFEGLIDEVRVYNRALGAGEVAADGGAGIETPSRTPVAAYSFDAGEGEVAEDLFGEHDGAIEGASWFDKGKYGQALSFDGENDCVTIEDAPDLQLTEELTLEAWVKPEGNGASEPIIFKETPWFGGYSLYFGIFENGHMEGFLGEEGYVFKSTEDPEKLDLNAWSHVALTFDGSELRLYVDGELVDSTSAEGAWATSGPLSIGCSVEFEDEFEGKIDEVRVYNRALSAGEIGLDAGRGLRASSRTPVAAYSFDAGEGEVAEDLFGEHDGAIEGASWFDKGKYGQALSFDGENDCVMIEDAEDLRITEELTVEAWVKPYAPLSDDPVIYKDAFGNKAHTLGIGILNYGKPEGFIGEGGGEYENIVSSKAVEPNVWSHLAFTYDGAHMRLYVDGELVASKAQAQGPVWGEGDLVIGCNPNYSPERFEGLIDEVQIYNRALGGEEIRVSSLGDRAGPAITLSGTATETIAEGPGSYSLQILAQDGDKRKHQTGVTGLTVSVDGIVQAQYKQKCPAGNCALEKTWEYEPASYEGRGHRIEVAATDALGNSSVESFIAATQAEEIRRCTDDETGQIVESTEKEMPSGGTMYTTQLGEGAVEETAVPPSGFNPIEATDEELAEYHFPERPKEAGPLSQWEKMMGAYKEVEPGPPNPCALNSGSMLNPEEPEKYKPGEPHESDFWSGFTAFRSAGPEYYLGGYAEFIQPASHPTDCDQSRVSTWVGVGGVEAGGGLIQAGTVIGEDNRIRAVYEWIRGNNEGIEYHSIPRETLAINSGDKISVLVRWLSPAHNKFSFFIMNNRTGKTLSKRVDQSVTKNPARFYQGSTIEFIDERIKPTDLKNFKETEWFNTEVINKNGEFDKLGNVQRYRWLMKRNGKLLAGPGELKPSKDSFVDNFFRCSGR